MKMNVVTFGAVLLLVGGLINTVPSLAVGLQNLFGGTPVPQIAIGAISVVVGLVIFFKRAIMSEER